MLENLIIRPETPADWHETEHMVMRSFYNKYKPGCNEHLMVRVIRQSPDYLPALSRVAEWEGRIVGAVYYTRARVVDGDTAHEVVTFGPLAVEPTMEGHDIGGALMRSTIALARDAGVLGIVIAGEPYYYPRFGFERCAEHGITDAQGNVYDAYMCLPLRSGFSAVKGILTESADFEKIDDPDLLREISREFPAYRKVKVQEGFLQIHGQHLGVVEEVQGDGYRVRYWELLIPAKLADTAEEKPAPGSDVLFIWNRRGESKITKVIRNLLEA
ncbi:MAG: N-acetyltransferase [Clostridia bacterium]|nr:N-acetyltransferase [Clostridia bacterium]